MENYKETLENYRIEREEDGSRLAKGLTGLFGGMFCGNSLVHKTLDIASEMYNYMQANPDTHIKLSQFYNFIDSLETMMYTSGIVFGGALLSISSNSLEYKICKKSEEDSEED